MRNHRIGYIGFCLGVLAICTPWTGWSEDTKAPGPANEKVTILTSDGGIIKGKVPHEAVRDFTDNSAGDKEISIKGDTLVIVKKAPPAPKDEAVQSATRPGEGFVWVPGYWQWDASTSMYVWVQGMWRRGVPSAAWHPGRWVKEGDGYVWQVGFWGSPTVTEPVIVREAPPVPQVETRIPTPGEGYVWVPGSWSYQNGKYVWIPGAWQRPAAAGTIWAPANWIKTTGGYEFIPGHWDYPYATRTYVKGN